MEVKNGQEDDQSEQSSSETSTDSEKEMNIGSVKDYGENDVRNLNLVT